MVTRFVKSIMVLSIGLFALFVALNNVLDYNSNYQFVQHVLSMDSTFEGNELQERGIESKLFYKAAYTLIILCEGLIAFLCLLGGLKLLRTIKSGALFQQSKDIALLGLTLGFLCWFVGFMVIGGEWFLMWQSEVWNGIQSSFRFSVIILLVTLILIQFDDERDGLK